MKLAASNEVVIKACPKIPTRVIQEAGEGIFHTKLSPNAINNTLSTNKLLVGRVKRAIRKLVEMEENAFCWRRKIPCGVKNTGTINHIESNPRINNRPCANKGLAAITNASTTMTGVPIISASIIYNTDNKIVCKIDWPNRRFTGFAGSVTTSDTQRKNIPPNTR